MNWRDILIAWSVQALRCGDIDRADWLDQLRTKLEAGKC